MTPVGRVPRSGPAASDNEATIEAAGVNQFSFTAPGDDHTLIQSDDFYTMEVEGVALVDWLSRIVAGEEVDDVHCTDCT